MSLPINASRTFSLAINPVSESYFRSITFTKRYNFVPLGTCLRCTNVYAPFSL